MNSALAITMVEAAWASHGGAHAPVGDLASAYNRVSPLSVTTATMGVALQTVRALHKANDPAVKGKIVAACEGYGRGAIWYRVDVDVKTADEHTRYTWADMVARLVSDTASEVRPGAASAALREDLANLYKLVIRPSIQSVMETHGVPIVLPAELPVNY